MKAVFKNRFAALEVISDAFRALSLEEALAALEGAGIVHSKIYRNAEVIEDPQLIANHLIVGTDSTEPGYDRALASPIRIQGSPQETPGRAPKIGQHTQALLLEQGFSQAQIDALIDDKVVAEDRA